MEKTIHKPTRNRKGEGSICQKANGTYLGRITIGGYPPFSCTGKTKREVQKKLNEFRLKTLRQEVIPRKQSVSSYIQNWLTTVKQPSLKPASYDRLERTFQKQIEHTAVGRSQLGNLTSQDIQNLINGYAKSLSYSSIKKVYELLNNCFRYAVSVRDLNFNPVDGVHMPKEENLCVHTKSIQILSPADISLIEAAARMRFPNGSIKYRYAPAYILILNTGLRSGEALALTWDHVNFEARTITVSQNASRIKNRNENELSKSKQIITSVKTKTGERIIPLNPRALNALQELKKYQTDNHIKTNFVISTSTGRMVVQNSFYRTFQSMQAKLGITPVTVHALRHTFATNLLEQGVDIKVISQLLGHSSVKITYDTYVHTNISKAFVAVNALENIAS